MRSKLTTALMGVTMAVVLAACVAPSGDGPTRDLDFWGNPIEAVDETTCEIVRPPAPPYDPATDTRPPDVTPGFSWMTYEIEVEALSADGNLTRLCVPVEAYAYSASGEPDTLTLNRAGLPAGAVTWTTVTPIRGEYLALQYDPTEERFTGRPPEYEVHISAKYLPALDEVADRGPFMLVCTIRVAGAPVRREPVVVNGEDELTTASCTLTGNTGWRLY